MTIEARKHALQTYKKNSKSRIEHFESNDIENVKLFIKIVFGLLKLLNMHFR